MNQAIHSVDLLLWLMGTGKIGSRDDGQRMTHERIEVRKDIGRRRTVKVRKRRLGVVRGYHERRFRRGHSNGVEIAGSGRQCGVGEEDLTQWTVRRGTDGGQCDPGTPMVGKKPKPAAVRRTRPPIGHHGPTPRCSNDFLEREINEGRGTVGNGVEGRRALS